MPHSSAMDGADATRAYTTAEVRAREPETRRTVVTMSRGIHPVSAVMYARALTALATLHSTPGARTPPTPPGKPHHPPCAESTSHGRIAL